MSEAFVASPQTAGETEPIAHPQDLDRERLIVYIVGSRDGVLETIHNLHRRGFAEVNDWSPLLPAQNPSEVMSLLWRDRVVGRSAPQ